MIQFSRQTREGVLNIETDINVFIMRCPYLYGQCATTYSDADDNN